MAINKNHEFEELNGEGQGKEEIGICLKYLCIDKSKINI